MSSLVSLAALTVIGMGHYHNSRGNALVQLPSKATGTVLRHDSLGISIVVVRLTLAQVAEVRVLYPQPIASCTAAVPDISAPVNPPFCIPDWHLRIRFTTMGVSLFVVGFSRPHRLPG